MHSFEQPRHVQYASATTTRPSPYDRVQPFEADARKREDSDDNGFALGGSGDNDTEDAALTSQSLNADGTPKRPMNAFMVFARRRRPQVSAENQSMRTGEISKILSKEWATMNATDKQFYLDQAKLLKETFNSKYPDYVYRRRPNNSRKKRKTVPSDGEFDAMPSSEADVESRTNTDVSYPPRYPSAASPFDSRLPSFEPRHPPSRMSSYASYGNNSSYGSSDYPHHSSSHHAPSWLESRPKNYQTSEKSYLPPLPSPHSHSHPVSYSPSPLSPTSPNTSGSSAPSAQSTNYTYPALNGGSTPFNLTGAYASPASISTSSSAYNLDGSSRGYTASPGPASTMDGGNPYPRPRALPPLSNLMNSASGGPLDSFQWDIGRRVGSVGEGRGV